MSNEDPKLSFGRPSHEKEKRFSLSKEKDYSGRASEQMREQKRFSQGGSKGQNYDNFTEDDIGNEGITELFNYLSDSESDESKRHSVGIQRQVERVKELFLECHHILGDLKRRGRALAMIQALFHSLGEVIKMYLIDAVMNSLLNHPVKVSIKIVFEYKENFILFTDSIRNSNMIQMQKKPRIEKLIFLNLLSLMLIKLL